MSTVRIVNGKVDLQLTSPMSRVRICDGDGNRVARPVTTPISAGYFVEWMITNDELIELIKQKLNQAERRDLIKELNHTSLSLSDSEYHTRDAIKKRLPVDIERFSVWEYEEKFYSFEKALTETIGVKITFKMGDYTLAAHMFILLKLNSSDIKLKNVAGPVTYSNGLGSGAICSWNPDSVLLIEIAKTLAQASTKHKMDILKLLSSF